MKEFIVGQEVIIVHAWDGTMPNTKGKVVKDRPERDEIRVGEDWHHRAYVFPLSAEQDIHKVQMAREKIRLALIDSMSLVYDVCNKKSRGEYK